MLSPQRSEELRYQENVIERGPEAIAIRTARALIDAGAVQYDFENGYRFVSGIQSPIYIDSRRLFNKPESRSVIGGLLREFGNTMPHHDAVAGTAIGGVMPAFIFADLFSLPFVYVRKDEKQHGTKKQVEAGEVSGQHVLLVDDLVNLGTSSLPAVEALRNAGATVTDVLTITTYGFTKTEEQFRASGLRLHTLTTVPVIVETSYLAGRVTREEADKVLAWLKEQDKNNEKVS